MLWPDRSELGCVAEMLRPAGVGLPSATTVVDAMRPVARAALLLGYACPRLRIGRPGGQGGNWTVIDLEELTLHEFTETGSPPHSGVTVELLCEPIVDRELVEHDDGTIGSPESPSNDTDTPSLDPAVDYSVTNGGSARTFVVGSAQSWSGGTPPFAEDISSLVDDAVLELAALHPDATQLRRPHAGLVWLFDPANWDRTRESIPGDLDVALEPLADVSSFLATQISAIAGRCSLTELLEDTGTFSAPSQVWRAITDGLSARGERHRLTREDEDRIAKSDIGPPWIDALAWCVRRGVIVVDSLLEVPEAPDPIEVIEHHDASISIEVWGEEEIVCSRVHPGGHSIWGGISWDYAPGTDTTRPQVIVVASRGIEIACSPAVRATTGAVVEPAPTDEPPSWDLQIHRVQHTDLVPPVGGAIDTALLSAPAYIEEGLPLLVQPKPDGVLLVYPAPPQGQAISGSSQDGRIRDVVELTVDPFSAEDWFELDCHTTSYPWASGGLPNAQALHLVVRATMNVEIATNRANYDNDNPLLRLTSWWNGVDLDEVVGRGMIVNDHPNHVFGSSTNLSGWAFSAEFWRVIEPPSAGAFGRPWEVLERPWVRNLAVLPDALAQPNPDPASLGPTRTWEIGTHTVTSYTDGDAELFPAAHVYRQYGYVDSFVFDLIDVVIGFVPFVGDIADVAEVVLAWQTGHDKWGRPVSNFQLSLMVVGASVPLVSSGFARRAGEKIADIAAPAFHAGPADYLAGSAIPAFDGFADEALAATQAPRLWQSSEGIAAAVLGQSTQLGDDLFGAVAQNVDSIGRLADDVVDVAYGTGVRTADLLGDDGGFWVHAFHVPSTRYARSTGTLPSPYAWLDLQTTGRLSTVTGAIIHVDPNPVRLIQPRSRHPSAMRALQSGPSTLVSSWSNSDVTNGVQSALGRITTRAWTGRGVFEGAVRPAAEIVTDGHLPVRSEALDLFGGSTQAASLMTAGAEKLATLAASRPGGLEELLGHTVVAGRELSDNERALRFAKGLYIAALEVEEHGLHALVDLADSSPTALRRTAAETIFADELLPALLEFERQWINRSIHEHALRFEFRQTAVAEAALRSAERQLVHQLKLLSLDGSVLKSGPDSTMFMQALATFLQWKAYQSPVALFGGKISAEFADGQWVVKGGDFVQQHITDQLRALRQGGKVPGPTAALQTGPVTDPANLAGWVDVSRVSVQVFDDSYMINSAITKMNHAAQRKGSKTLELVDDVSDMPKSMRRFLASRLGESYRLQRHPVMVELLRTHVLAYARAQESAINAALVRPDMVAALGRETSVIIRAASEGLDDVPAAVAARL